MGKIVVGVLQYLLRVLSRPATEPFHHGDTRDRSVPRQKLVRQAVPGRQVGRDPDRNAVVGCSLAHAEGAADLPSDRDDDDVVPRGPIRGDGFVGRG
ncbi:hypothetical protein [Azospirillum canadense]|uniref:hypothetical protein n=1 Tax=Azospirillum canadense TaxID=403962 RepID=UPI002227338D|nr:hypothetical protein [Azospirillum canadense]MCW2241501.1 hypothetical protein [Azospirillum canadense]